MEKEYITKQDAVDILVHYRDKYGKDDRDYYDTMSDAIMYIEDLSIEDVEPVKNGHWKPFYYTGKFHCSECGYLHEPESHTLMANGVPVVVEYAYFKHCPECGAKMKGMIE